MKSISICRTDTTVQRRTSIQALPVCALRETEQSGHLNVRTVLRHYVPNKGLRPLRYFAAILVDISCPTDHAQSGRYFFARDGECEKKMPICAVCTSGYDKNR